MTSFAQIAIGSSSSGNIQVTLTDGTKLDCSKSISFPAACTDSDKNRYLIEASERFANAIKMDSQGSFNFAYIEVASVNGQIVFASNPFPESRFSGMSGSYSGATFKAPPSTHTSDLAISNGILSNLKISLQTVTDPEAFSLIKDMLKQAQDTFDKSSAALSSTSVQVELDDGKKINCERLKPSTSTFPCNIYQCSPPSAGFYVNTYFGGGTFISFDNTNDNITSLSEPAALWNPRDQEKPLNAKIDMSKMLGTMGAYTPPPPLPGELDPATQMARQTPRLSEELAWLGDPMFRMTLTSYIQTCDQVHVEKLNQSVQKIREKIAEADLVQLVEVSNNILTSRFINSDAIPENSCRDGDVWYRDQSYDYSRAFVAEATPKTIDLATAQRLFNEARAMKDIAWDYKADGCYARAHLMAKRFEEQGIHVDKVWIKGDLRVPDAGITWNFHVAPIVYVENEQGEVKRMVIDPSLTDGPVSVEQWSSRMQKGGVGKTLETEFPFPQNSINFEHTSIAYSNSYPYLPSEQMGTSDEEKMQLSTETMERYLEFSR